MKPTRLEVIVTDSVVEALALENNLIKQRAPRYNILLRDDKNYPYLQLTTTEAFPRVLVARSVERDGNMYAGPFLPAKFARRTMSLTHKVFGIRSCNEVITGTRQRPCLEYDIKRCLAPCVATICSEERYAVAVADTRLFLEGRNQELAEQLRGRMLEAAADQRFEEAAQLRDAMRTVEAVRERQQKMASAELGDRDVFGVKVGASGAVVQVFIVRGGRVIERVEFIWDARGERRDRRQSGRRGVEAAIQQFYSDQEPPPEIHVPVAPPEQQVLEDWLARSAERKVRIVVPQRGTKKGMMELAHRNAALGYRTALRCECDGQLRRARIAAGGVAIAEAAAAHRLLRHLDDPGQRDGRVDGGVRRGPDAPVRVPQIQDQEGTDDCKPASPQAPRTPRRRGSSTTSPRWSRSCAGVTRRCSRTAGRFPI